jgi:hypothetical protein
MNHRRRSLDAALALTGKPTQWRIRMLISPCPPIAAPLQWPLEQEANLDLDPEGVFF